MPPCPEGRSYPNPPKLAHPPIRPVGSSHKLGPVFGLSDTERYCVAMADLPLIAASWHRYAYCRDTDPDLWFPDRHEATKSIRAKQVCHECPVRTDCLAHAIDHTETHGIWGATSPTDRQKIRKRLRAYGWRPGQPVRLGALIAADPTRPTQLKLVG